MTTATPLDLTPYTGKRVTLTFLDQEDEGKQVAQEGLVELATEQGVMFKKRGSSGVQLIEAKDVVDVAELPSKEPNVTVKKLQPIAAGRVRQHLVDRHGFAVAVANTLSEVEATVEHDKIDHSVLGHVHVTPQAEKDAAAGQATGEEPLRDLSHVEGAEPEDADEDDDLTAEG